MEGLMPFLQLLETANFQGTAPTWMSSRATARDLLFVFPRSAGIAVYTIAKNALSEITDSWEPLSKSSENRFPNTRMQKPLFGRIVL